MATLAEKFYGTGEPASEEEIKERLKEVDENKRFGVRYTTVKYYISESSAKLFYENIESGAELVKKDPKTGMMVTKKSK